MNSHIVSEVVKKDLKVLSHTEMMDDIIRLEGVSVRYRVPRERVGTFKEYIIRRIQRKVRFKNHWALNNINLTVKRGEVVGLIGHNGAGKSTLLKVVARVIKPINGRVVVKGQVAPLLGVGAGFHPELTGRENIFLYGALLGFSYKEMEEKLDRIVDFAELWDYIDAPLRTYSTGMRSRLGFAVATDTQPDILIVDEVLSVGDIAFRKKSAARMSDFFEQGTTIFLVSHSMSTVSSLCHRVAWIHQGELRMLGHPEQVISAYETEENTRKK
jgi:ABC-2 type transport system ATP-binding protein/lipopolysaccharide transport system ATP-binding protein